MKPIQMIAFMIGVVACGAANAQDCQPTEDFQTVVPGKLTVVHGEYPPAAFTRDGMRGYTAELIEQIAIEYCLEIDALPVEFAAVVQYLVEGRADVSIGGWYRSATRAEVVGVSAPVVLDQMAIYSKDGLDSIEQLAGKSVGTVSGFMWVPDLQEVFGNNLQLYPNPVTMAQDLASGRLDAGIDGYATGLYAQQTGNYPAAIQIKVPEPDPRVGASVLPAQTGFLYAKENTEFGAALDASIVRLRNDGTLASILVSYGLDPVIANVGEPRLVD
ncbi:substrate-binding periplasmic protein [Pelagibacterium sediminicola]|uniref:substrate-binding periplasmic protein n=1 Tax=Pelagibacterium sediminicola TaxID=2248761 RepID=UPI0018E59A3D|nr:transporter substrate-binding domain-containing protein [Pelagibacterium sediminicola]